MSLPAVGDETFTEREGVNEVARVVNRARCLWRETTMHDVGIDGQIEYVHANEATGRIVFVQIKTGVSFFKAKIGNCFRYYPQDKHVNYWESAPLPVILILRNPEADLTCWVDARDSLRSGNKYIDVPSDNMFSESGVLRALERSGPLPTSRSGPAEIFAGMVNAKSPSADLPVDFSDLFVHGLTDLVKSVYFDMGLVMDIAQAKQALLNPGMGVGIGAPEYDHLFKYISFLIAHDLARVDYDYFIRHWDHLKMVGRFIAPLTARGRELVDHIHELDSQWQEQATPSVGNFITLTDAQYLAVLNSWRLHKLPPSLTQVPGIRVIQDKAFQGIYPFEVVRRVPVFEAFKRWYIGSRSIGTADS